jgi:hypothetical protein
LAAADPSAVEITPLHQNENEWAWKVIPRKSGHRKVELKVSVTANVDDETHTRTLPPVSQTFLVTPISTGSARGLLESPAFWGVAVISLLVAMLLWLRNRLQHAG